MNSEIGEPGDERAVRRDVDQPESALTEQRARDDEEQRGREHPREWPAPTATPDFLALQRSDQVGRLLGGDLAATATAMRGARAGLEMFTGGLFTDDRWLAAFNAMDLL